MHGAMVAEGYDDCEGDLLARLRAVIGPDAVMGGELDLHCHITPLMLEAATALVTYKEYPHIDIGERAEGPVPALPRRGGGAHGAGDDRPTTAA